MRGGNLPTVLMIGVVVAGLCALEVLYGNSVSKTTRRDTTWMQDVEDSAMLEDDAHHSTPTQQIIASSATNNTRNIDTIPTLNHQNMQLQCNGDLTQRDPYKTIMGNLTADQLDMSDRIFRRGGWDIDPFVVESHKLVFFTVPKNSCTEWKRLFKRMLNHSDWSVYGNAHVHDPLTNRLKYLGHYQKEQQIEFMTSPEWTRAIFVRDPFQRLLSAYLDKALNPDRHIQRHCCNSVYQMKFKSELARQQCMILNRLARQGKRPTIEGNEFPFATFVTEFAQQCNDAHWAPQSQRLKPANWKFINYVGHFENLEHDARCLLEKIGAWDDFGASGWGKDGSMAFFQRNTAPHSTSAQNRQESYYTPDLMQAAWRHLKRDYDLPILGFTKPEGIGSQDVKGKAVEKDSTTFPGIANPNRTHTSTRDMIAASATKNKTLRALAPQGIQLEFKGDLTKCDTHKTIMGNLTADQLDMSDPIFRRQGWDIDPFVVESHKLVFFTVPKNSCTEWKTLFKRMLNHSDWNLRGNWANRIHNPQTNGLKYLGQYAEEKQVEFMTSPEWTRAVFVRDPLQRLLSAYLDKANSSDRHVHRHCCNSVYQMKLKSALARQQCSVLNQLEQKGKHPTPEGNEFPFVTFVTEFAQQCNDAHWAPQSQRLKPANWKFINYVGHFENLEHDARCLLEKIGAWEEFGANGWGKYGNQALFQRNSAPHSTSAKDRQALYYTQDILQAAWMYAKQDYNFPVFDFTKPEGIE